MKNIYVKWMIGAVGVVVIILVVSYCPTAHTREVLGPSQAIKKSTIYPAELYPKGSIGFAISYPQCGKNFPDTPHDFGILGVTKGYSLTKNPCLKSELEWASRAKYAPSFYINLSYPDPFTKSTINSLGCELGDKKCIAYHFGYRTAQEAHLYAVSQGARSAAWWLDMQTISSWSSDKTINGQVVLGAVAYFKAQGLPVGLSTTPYQWNSVAGGLDTLLPTWIPGRDKETVAQYCRTGKSYSGGRVEQLAYVENNFEVVYACGL